MSRPAISHPIPMDTSQLPSQGYSNLAAPGSYGTQGSSVGSSVYATPPSNPTATFSNQPSYSSNPPSQSNSSNNLFVQSVPGSRDVSGAGGHAGSGHSGASGSGGGGSGAFGAGGDGRGSGSGGGRQVSGPRGPGPTSTLDSYITRLLVVTKQLLQGLEQWSQRQLSEEAVSDIYVRLGNGFEMCVSTFRRAGISTADLDSVPSDLREILERALAEEPSQDTLNIYLPDIRAIIFNLLNGLKNKQMAYKRQLADRQPVDPLPAQAPMPPMPSATPARPQPRQQSIDAEARSVRSMTSDGPTSPASTTGTLPGGSRALAERSQHRTTRPPPPDAFRPSRTRPMDGSGGSGVGGPRTLSSSSIDRPPHPRATSPIPSAHSSSHGTPPTGAAPGRHPRRPERASRESNNVTSRFSADSDISAISSQRPTSDGPAVVAMPIPIPHSQQQQQQQPPLPLPPGAGPTHMQLSQSQSPQGPVAKLPTATPPAPTPPPPPPAPSTPPMPALPTLNLPEEGDGELEILNGSAPHTPRADEHPTARSSFARLQNSDALERRASKRFSSYTFNKMVGVSPSGKKSSSSGTGSPPRPARRGNHRDIPPMPSLSESRQSRGLSMSAEAASGGSTPSLGVIGGDLSPVGPGFGQSPDRSPRSADEGSPAVPTSHLGSPVPSPAPAHPHSVVAFLQLGRQVKKSTVEVPLTMSALRLLFMERFEYDPGMEDFPDVYIKDPKTGVQYELEDMDDVKDGCVLSLDIEPLDQIKQHFDLTVAGLTQELKDLKTAFVQSKRQSTGPIAPSLLAISPVLPAAPQTPEQPAPPPPRAVPQRTASGRVTPAAELRMHYDEVQSLRRDLAIVRQIHVDFLAQTKESFSALRAQNNAMREVVKTKMGGNRALLDNSKAKLEGQCQDTIQAVEEVSDIIDGAREDALRRGITPAPGGMNKIRSDLAKATALVDEFSHNVTLAEPTWRATWMSELQRVTEEQRLLAYQNKLAADLKNDIKDATEMLDNVSAFVQQRAAGSVGKARFQPPPPDEGGIPNLLLEIRTKESDPNQRLRAIEEQQRQREKELANKTDEFQDELGAFVAGKKLRKTGGTDEAERVRQRRQDQTIRRMLTDGTEETLSPQLTGASLRSASGAGGGGGGV